LRLYLRLLRDTIDFLGWRFPAIIVLMTLVGLTEGLSIALLLPLLDRIGISQTATANVASVAIEKIVGAAGVSGNATGILLLVTGVAFALAVLFIVLGWISAVVTRRYASYRRSQLFETFLRADWSFFVGHKSGELTSALVTECERLAQSFTIGLYLVSTFVVTVVYLGIAVLVSWQVTLALVCCGLLLALAMGSVYRRSYAAGSALSPLSVDLQSAMGESFAGIKIVKATTSENRIQARVDRILAKLDKVATVALFLPSFARGWFEFAAFALLATILVFAKTGLGLAAGNIIVVVALFVRLSPRLTTMQAQIHNLNGFIHAIEVVDRLREEAASLAEPAYNAVDTLPVDMPTSLAIKGVQVCFGERVVLKNVDLTWPIPGMVGIIGGSGAGKSTLIHTIIGLVAPSSGTITLGDYRLSPQVLHAWRRQIGYVPQETLLFHASVRDNLTLAKPDASLEEIEMAARRAQAHDFIAALPEGYDTVVGDQGVKLSGGQRQRLGIARALLTSPVLLVLDEAMSALDAQSEAELMQTLEALRSQMGILIVAHRLGAVRTADLICVLEAGEVIEAGTWNDLMDRKSRLFKLVEAQSFAHGDMAVVRHSADEMAQARAVGASAT
jgi:ATP-binding cassette subfamily C protein